MIKFTKPMQPCNADLEKITFPCLAQKKIDGMKMIIRSDNQGGMEFFGRSMKPITNQWIIEKFSAIFEDIAVLSGWVFEGELQAGDSFEGCDGLLSAKYREFDDVIYHMFDEISDMSLPYSDRWSVVAATVNAIDHPMVMAVHGLRIKDMDGLMLFHDINDRDPGLDGTIVRWEDSIYKPGKRTENEKYVLKIKDFQDIEVEIVAVNELLNNHNEGFTNPLGRTERSTAQDSRIAGGTLGSFTCQMPSGAIFAVGSFRGMSRDTGQKLWDRREELSGKLIKIKYMRLSQYGVPIHPVYLGFRDPIDLD